MFLPTQPLHWNFSFYDHVTNGSSAVTAEFHYNKSCATTSEATDQTELLVSYQGVKMLVSNQSPRNTLKTKKNKKAAGVDTCWHVAALGFLAIFLGTAAESNSAFFYIGFMDQFDVNRETATWPGSVVTALSHVAGK
ncbi:monocarboxylate transporter 12 [Ixodes scapularis]